MYDKVGGFGAVSRIVLNFYNKSLESDAIAPYFASVDMQRLIDHQTQFICSLLGGPASFSDDQIRDVHRGVKISEDAFDQFLELFEEALREAELEAADVAAVVQLCAAASRREMIDAMQEPYLTVFQCFNSLTLGIFVCDPDGLTIRFANERAEQWFGPGLQGRPLASAGPHVPNWHKADMLNALMNVRYWG